MDPLTITIIAIVAVGLLWIGRAREDPPRERRTVYPYVESQDDSPQYTAFPEVDCTWAQSPTADPLFNSRLREANHQADERARHAAAVDDLLRGYNERQ